MSSFPTGKQEIPFGLASADTAQKKVEACPLTNLEIGISKLRAEELQEVEEAQKFRKFKFRKYKEVQEVQEVQEIQRFRDPQLRSRTTRLGRWGGGRRSQSSGDATSAFKIL